MKNKQVNPDDYSKEELRDTIHILEENIKDSNISITKERLRESNKKIESNLKKLGSVFSSNKFKKLIGIADWNFY